jgi:hypothetical protein
VATSFLRLHDPHDPGEAARPIAPIAPIAPITSITPIAPARPGRNLRIAARSGGQSVVFVVSSDVWAFEACGRLVFVHSPQGRFDIDLSLLEIGSTLGPPFLRVHRSWLVDLTKVRELSFSSGAMLLFAGSAPADRSTARRGVEVPVSRERVRLVRRKLLADTFGLRPARRDRAGRPRSS